LAQAVEAAGHTVAIIDRKESAFRRLDPEFSGKRIVGVGFDRNRLEEAGIQDARAVASVTNGDNSNIMIARVAKETYAIDRVVARIYDPRRAAIYERLGIRRSRPCSGPSSACCVASFRNLRRWSGSIRAPRCA